ncbi:MAG: hypothetical protein GY722_27750, partial [bacterium]|nr:hypothetical protein [bacterium]
PRHPYAALASIAGKWQRIFAYDAFDPEDPWEYFDPTVPDWANDLRLMVPGRGYWVLASEAVTLEVRNQGPPPTVSLASPADLAVVTEPTEITGTVDSDRLQSWTLTSRPIGDGDAVALATSTAPVSSGTLATFDPTLLLNGLYELELTATDIQGQQASQSIAVSVEGQMKIGHFNLSFLDLAVPVSGLDIEIYRTYDSRDKQQRDFGVGWSLDIRQGSYRNNRPPGDGWQLKTGLLPCDTVLESKSHLTVVRLSDREVYRFALRLQDGVPSTGGGCFADARFDFIDGPLPGTALEILGQTQVFYENGSDRVIDVDTLDTYEPEDVRLTTRDGRIFELDLSDGVTLVEDLNGNRLSITPAGITHSSGKGIVFERDAQGRLTRITDPLDRVNSYSYDTAGDLVHFTDRGRAATRFTYDGVHRLLDIEDPRGVKPIRNEYDSEGRIVRHIDAYGKVIELGHDLDNRREVVTNRLGHSRVLEYDARGNVMRETDELGNATIRSFDGRDNLLSQTDPLQRTTSYIYTAENDLATVTDPLGNVTAHTYNTRGQQLTITNPRGAVTRSVYDDRGNLTQTIDALGKMTSFTYDPAGNLLATTDALGHVTTFEVDTFGNPTREIDALGNETDSTYDGAGNRLTETRTRSLADGSTETLLTTFFYDALDRAKTTIAADGSSTSTSYDLLGNVTNQIDQLGRQTTLTYDLMGRLVATTYPDGTTASQSYDDEGRRLSKVDRDGHATSFSYDPAGRLLETTFPDGSSTSSAYDAAGQLIATTDAGENTTTYTYNAAGQRTAIIDPLGNSSTFTYDAAGNMTATVDANGNATGFVYNALNRLVTTSFANGTTTQVEYDDRGRRIAETDQRGVTYVLAYDPLGHLISVTDAVGHVTAYAYDEVGNRLTQTNANGHTTSFEYDPLGRQTARVLADGSRESMVYNADGTLASHSHFNGATRTFEYDTNRRLIRRAYPNGSQVIFTYTPSGQRLSVSDTHGTTTYSYDNRNRIMEKTDHNGFKLAYSYDALGNRTSLTATAGSAADTVSYTYDSLSRLDTVTDGQGDVTTFDYKPNGMLSSVGFANGVVTTYVYDNLNRLTNLTSEVAATGYMLLSYDYTLDEAGNRTKIDEHDGTTRRYKYNELYRLLQDRVTDYDDTLVYQRDFTYDPAGNRTTTLLDEGAGPVSSAYTHDTRGRMLSAGTASFSWDANGNLTSKAGEAQATYQWDSENRLTSMALEDGTLIEIAYDADGNRIRSVVEGATGGPITVDYLVDTSGPLSEVVADVVNGSIQNFYIRSRHHLVGFYRPESDTKRYYHADALGSIRALSNEAAEVTDRYSYYAFGKPLAHDGIDQQPFRFAGETYEPRAELSYNRARWLHLPEGRFISADPFAGFIERPISLHSYLYADLNPILSTDPSGRFTKIEAVALVGIAINLALIGRNVIKWIRRVKYPPGPEELLRKQEVLNALNSAWADSEPFDPASHHEEGGWIFMNPYGGAIETRRAPPLPLPRGRSRIDLRNPPLIEGFYLVAMFHTHPAAEYIQEGNKFYETEYFPEPSPHDKLIAAFNGVPGIVRNKNGHAPYGTPRESFRGHLNYPDPWN